MASAVTRGAPSPPLSSTTSPSSCSPDSSPGAAARFSPARESAPACSGESKAAADLSPHLTESRSAETALPSAISESVRHRACRVFAAVLHSHESARHHRPTRRVLPSWPSPQTTGSSRSTPYRSTQARPIHGKTSPFHPTRDLVSFLPSPQSPYQTNKSVANWDDNHIQ